MRRFVCFSYTLPAGAAIAQRPGATTHWKRILPLLLLVGDSESRHMASPTDRPLVWDGGDVSGSIGPFGNPN
jgi:hypothetical protein